MKNFGLALIIFLVWSFFGLWLYSWVSPNTPNTSISEVLPKEKTKQVDTPVIKDTLTKKENTEVAALKNS